MNQRGMKFYLTSPLWIEKFLWRAVAVISVSSCSEEIRSRWFIPRYQPEEIGGHLQGVLHSPKFDKQRKTNSLNITKLAPWHSRGERLVTQKTPHMQTLQRQPEYLHPTTHSTTMPGKSPTWYEIIRNVERFTVSKLFHNLPLPVCNSWPATETRVNPSNERITGSTNQPIIEIITGTRTPDCSPEDPQKVFVEVNSNRCLKAGLKKFWKWNSCTTQGKELLFQKKTNSSTTLGESARCWKLSWPKLYHTKIE